MAKILFVHGMRMQDPREPSQGSEPQVPYSELLHKAWYGALLGCLQETEWGRANPQLLPTKDDVELVYWGDFFKRSDPTRPIEQPKGVALDAVRSAYYALLRGLVLLADQASWHTDEGRPRGPVALMVDELVYQSAVYMQNGPVFHPKEGVGDGAFFQVQARFEEKIKKGDTQLVIAHSLGTVVAYEGLCRNPHNVHTLMTVGSPIATPNLILEPLRERLARLLNHSVDLPPPWPGVRQWLNFYAPADVWCVPIPRLAPIFGEAIRDIEVVHGSPHDFVNTHKLTTYLRKHQAVFGNEIARVLRASASPDSVGPTASA